MAGSQLYRCSGCGQQRKTTTQLDGTSHVRCSGLGNWYTYSTAPRLQSSSEQWAKAGDLFVPLTTQHNKKLKTVDFWELLKRQDSKIDVIDPSASPTHFRLWWNLMRSPDSKYEVIDRDTVTAFSDTSDEAVLIKLPDSLWATLLISFTMAIARSDIW